MKGGVNQFFSLRERYIQNAPTFGKKLVIEKLISEKEKMVNTFREMDQ